MQPLGQLHQVAMRLAELTTFALGIAQRQVFQPEVVVEMQIKQRAIHVEQHGVDIRPVDHRGSSL